MRTGDQTRNMFRYMRAFTVLLESVVKGFLSVWHMLVCCQMLVYEK